MLVVNYENMIEYLEQEAPEYTDEDVAYGYNMCMEALDQFFTDECSVDVIGEILKVFASDSKNKLDEIRQILIDGGY